MNNMCESERGTDIRKSRDEWTPWRNHSLYRNNIHIPNFPIMCKCTTGILDFMDKKIRVRYTDIYNIYYDEIYGGKIIWIKV